MVDMEKAFKKKLMSVVKDPNIGYEQNYQEKIFKYIKEIPFVHLNLGPCEDWQTVEAQNKFMKEEWEKDGPNSKQLQNLIHHLDQNYTNQKLLKGFEIFKEK